MKYVKHQAFGKTMIIDLSHTIKSEMPVYPGSVPPEIVDLGLFEKHGVNVQKYTLTGHVGTHIDVPAHVYAGGNSTSTMDISNFFGTAQILDCLAYIKNQNIGIEVLNQFKPEDLPEFILLYTGWSKKWGSKEYFINSPIPSEDLICALAESNIKGVGVDTISIDPISDHHLPNHHKILGADKFIIENLTNLEKLTGNRIIFSCFPLKLQNGDGSFVRAVGISS